jgi:HK97 family phage major capsid protein
MDVNKINDTLTSLENSVNELAGQKSIIESVKDLPAMVKGMQDEIAKFATLQMLTPQNTEKALMEKKIDFYKSVLSGDRTKAAAYSSTISTGEGQIGYFIPQEWSTYIIDLANSYGEIASRARIEPMSNHIKYVNRYKEGVTAGMIAAGSAITQTAGSATQYTLTAEKIAALIQINNETLADVTPGAIAAIEKDAARGIAKRMDYAVTEGTGASDYNNVGITGILASTATNVVTMAASGVSTMDADDLATMIDALIYKPEAPVFCFNHTLRPYIQALKDTAGNYVFTPAGPGGVGTIWGFPVIWTWGIMPEATSVGSGTKFGFFGDINPGVTIGDRMSVEVMVNPYRLANQYQTEMTFIRRADAFVVGELFSVLKTA